MSSLRLSVILPCFNEEGNVALWEAELFPALDRLPFVCEVVVVDDGSTDGTAAAVEALTKRRPGVMLIKHEGNRGLGASLRTALSACRGDYILTLDADLTFPPSAILAMVAALAPNVDCICASPFLGRFTGVGPVRKLLSSGVNAVYRRLLGRPLTAVSALCRLYRASALRNLTLTSDSFDINAEIMFKLLANGAEVREVAAVLGCRRRGASKICLSREILNHLRMFARILAWRSGAA